MTTLNAGPTGGRVKKVPSSTYFDSVIFLYTENSKLYNKSAASRGGGGVWVYVDVRFSARTQCRTYSPGELKALKPRLGASVTLRGRC